MRRDVCQPRIVDGVGEVVSYWKPATHRPGACSVCWRDQSPSAEVTGAIPAWASFGMPGGRT